ncbi:hsp20-like protein [Drepanopeziza brunnea f. sp. 'multigermtubi' MB_m1]|uniref:Hsp20-like protein n=1 Tax=Marssonina brunnea f. sp. multigermtubi (strain MB_m1) TaxID=1072389 RepID=K1Y6A0_MARBU|nr:hsp20-like protein [Drepanopeziza brunnea f. sp. 'multigermtubi' MB_m1]EKD20709.1 hsp20-like protein [Drepanopeziza brunnea f. sp. 'multigermtubi' MB_m1]
MAYTNDQQGPFWDFVRGMDHNGAGVDRAGGPFNRGTQPGRPADPHPPPPPPFGTGFPFVGWGSPAHGHYHGPDSFPFGGPERHGREGPGFFGTRGGCGRRHHRENPGSERSRSRTGSPGGGHEYEHSGREGEARDDHPHPHPHPHPYGPRGDRHGRGGHGPRGERGPRSGHHGPERRGPPPPPFAAAGPMRMRFDLSGLYQALTSHPAIQQHPSWAHILRSYAPQARSAGERPGPRSDETGPADEDAPEDTFTPPIDVFSTEAAYVLHIALPGAKKEDVGVNWDADKGELNIAGVVYRPGDETFLKSLKSGERRVGAFERSVKLPPRGKEEEEEEEGAEVDGEGIGAKLEDGLLVITVPKVEREWIEVKKVDIN